MKLTTKQINEYVKDLIETNEIMWNAVGFVSDFLNNDITKNIKNSEIEKEDLIKIIKEFDKKSDLDFYTDLNLYEADFQAWDDITGDLQEFRYDGFKYIEE